MSGRSICVTVQPHRFKGMEAPLSCTTVGKRSMLLVGSSIFLPPGMVPGQRRIPGTWIPPSQLVDFPATQRSTVLVIQRCKSECFVSEQQQDDNKGMESFPQDRRLADIKEHLRVSDKSLPALWFSSAESKHKDYIMSPYCEPLFVSPRTKLVHNYSKVKKDGPICSL